jgi:hypothetical protein
MLNRLRWHLHDLDPELALVAIARSILVIVWHLLADPTARRAPSGR